MQFLALFSWVSIHFKIAQVALFSLGLVLVWVSMFVFWKACYNCGVSIFCKKNIFIDLLRPVVVVAAQAVQNKTVQQKSRKTTAKKSANPPLFLKSCHTFVFTKMSIVNILLLWSTSVLSRKKEIRKLF